MLSIFILLTSEQCVYCFPGELTPPPRPRPPGHNVQRFIRGQNDHADFRSDDIADEINVADFSFLGRHDEYLHGLPGLQILDFRFVAGQFRVLALEFLQLGGRVLFEVALVVVAERRRHAANDHVIFEIELIRLERGFDFVWTVLVGILGCCNFVSAFADHARRAAQQRAARRSASAPEERAIALVHLGPPRQEKAPPERAPAGDVVTYLD